MTHRPSQSDPKRPSERGPGSSDPRDGALLATDRMTRLGMLVASVAHEINNPITYIAGNLAELERVISSYREALAIYAKTVERELGRSGAELVATVEAKLRESACVDSADELLADSSEGALRIRDLVRELLHTSHPRENPRAPVDIHALLDFALRMSRHQVFARATVIREFHAPPCVKADRAQLLQVFLNLISNAARACDPPDPEGHEIRVCTRERGAAVEIEVHDSGIGVPDSLHGVLFEPFVTSRRPGEGTGLGLYVSRRIVEAHGGTLEFEPGRVGGAIFRVVIPTGPEPGA